MSDTPITSIHSAGSRISQAFSLIELQIVVAIIGIIPAIAVPSLLQLKAPANEASAISYMRQWTAAQQLYFLRFSSYADAAHNSLPRD